MARRKTRAAPRRRAPKSISLLNVVQSAAVASVATEGLLGVSLPEMVTGSGPGSLRGIAANPDQAFKTISQNAMNINNIVDIALKTAVLNFGFKFAKRGLRSSIREINKPLRMLNLGVRL